MCADCLRESLLPTLEMACLSQAFCTLTWQLTYQLACWPLRPDWEYVFG